MKADKPKRPSMSKGRRARLFLAHSGVCELCGTKIAGEYDIEHRIAWEISYDDSDANLYPAHKDCHSEKTKLDRKAIAKCHRIEKRINGTRRERQPIPGQGFQKPRGGWKWPKSRWPKKSVDP